MKSRIRKQISEQIELISGKDCIISLEEPIEQIDKKVRKIFEKTVRRYGELNKIRIIEKMKTEEFINHFSPITPEIKMRINKSVSELGELVILEELRKNIGNIQNDCKFTLETIIKQMKSENFLTKLKTLFPDNLAGIVGQSAKKYLQEKEEEFKQKNSEKELQIDIKNEDKREGKEYSTISLEEKQYFEKVKEFTNGFDFLARNLPVYTSESGKKNIGRFENLEQHTKFVALQKKVVKTMELLKVDEIGAIKSILEKKNCKLSIVDSEILSQRKQMLEKRNLIISQGELEK